MGLLDRLFNKPAKAPVAKVSVTVRAVEVDHQPWVTRPARPDAWVSPPGTQMVRSGSQPVVGEANYQAALEWVCCGRQSRTITECLAVIEPEPANTYDKNAVVVRVAGQTVGYIPRDATAKWRAVCKQADGPVVALAEIRGGWRDEQSQGNFGITVRGNASLYKNARQPSTPWPSLAAGVECDDGRGGRWRWDGQQVKSVG